MLTLKPAPSGRAFYDIRKGTTTIIGVINLTDEQAIDRKLRGWVLWPCEWGFPTPKEIASCR